MRCLLFLLALLTASGMAQAQQPALRWDKKTVEVQTGPANKTARAEFTFTNTSSHPVVIDAVKSSCGCTTAALEKRIYQPGEKGSLVGILTIGFRQGVQVKSIRVDVRGEPEPVLLTMVTHIAEPVKIDPPYVYWKAGGAPSPKTITLKLPAAMGVRLARVASSDTRIRALLETVREGTEYRITVTPEGTARPMLAVLNIQGTASSGEPRSFQAYAQVK